MLHHLSLPVSDISRSDAFYGAALATLGYVRVWADDDAVGYGPPGLRPHYGEHYYAAFVFDPDGYQVEAVINAAA